MTDEVVNNETEEVVEPTTPTSEETVPETQKEEETLLSKETSEEDVDGKSDTDTQGAPEEYEDFKLPEGMEANTEVIAEFKVLAKDTNLSQEQAQAFVDFYNNKMVEVLDSQSKAWTDTVEAWANEAKTDKEFGGAAFEANIAIAKSFFDKFGSPELMEALEFSGLGNHPAVIRLGWQAGKVMKEDTIAHGSPTGNAPEDAALRMYPTMKN